MTDNKGPQGAAGEVIQGKAILEAVHESESSSRRSRAQTLQPDFTASIGGVPHFESKADTEKLIKESELQWTILRPAAFMDFITLSGLGRYMTLGLIGAVWARRAAVHCDGGYWYRLRGEGDCRAGAIQRKDAGDELSAEEVQGVFKKVTGQRADKAPLPGLLAKMMLNHDLKQMFNMSYPPVLVPTYF